MPDGLSSSRPAEVVLLHAAVVGRWSLFLFARRLRALGFVTHNLPYPNRRLNVADCAEHLLPVWRRLADTNPDSPLHLAGHSMGGLVARRLLHLYQPPRFGRLVTLGTPHLGSPLADRLHHWSFYKWLFGPAGQDLVTDRDLSWPAPWPPPYPIGLIAGTIPIGPGSLHLRYPSDGTVTRHSAQPFGGTDYALVRATHTTIPYRQKTARLTAGFLNTGRFEAGLINKKQG